MRSVRAASSRGRCSEPLIFGLERQHRFTKRRRVDRVAPAQLRLHAQRAPALDDLQVDDIEAIQHTQVDRLVEAVAQLAHRRQRDLANAQRLMDRLPKLPDAQPNPVEIGVGVVCDEAAGA